MFNFWQEMLRKILKKIWVSLMLVLKAQIRRFLVWISISAQINDWCSNANLPWESMLIFVGHIFQEVFVQFKRKMKTFTLIVKLGNLEEVQFPYLLAWKNHFLWSVKKEWNYVEQRSSQMPNKNKAPLFSTIHVLEIWI